MTTESGIVPGSVTPAVTDDVGAQISAGLAGLGAATVHEAMGRRGFVGPELRPVVDGLSVAGPAVTVHLPSGDNLMIHAAIESCRPGDVLVVAMVGSTPHGLFGDLLATCLRARGVAAFITNGGVRDVAVLREMRYPVWSRHVSCEGTVKETLGSVNVPVVLGGQVVAPGDFVCADDDGVVVVPAAVAAEVLRRGVQRVQDEVVLRARLAGGELTLDALGLRPRLASRLTESGVTLTDRITRGSA